jgi:hypothetical protein
VYINSAIHAHMRLSRRARVSLACLPVYVRRDALLFVELLCARRQEMRPVAYGIALAAEAVGLVLGQGVTVRTIASPKTLVSLRVPRGLRGC